MQKRPNIVEIIGAPCDLGCNQRGANVGPAMVRVSLTQRIGWYERLGFAITHHEDMADRRLTHMRKTLAKAGQ